MNQLLALLLTLSIPLSSFAEASKVHLNSLMSSDEKATGPAPNPLPPSDRVGFAVVGLGHLALAEIIPAFGESKKAKLTALVSGDAKKMAAIGAQYGIDPKHQYSYENFENLKNDPAVQVIYIVLPNSMHKEFVLRSAAIGKDVLCEKPMATSVKDAEAMIQACRKAGVKLMIAYRMQYEPNNRAMIALTRDKSLGELKTMTAENAQSVGDATQWRLNEKLSGGGPLPDVGIYCINAARYITGEEPVEVSAMMTRNPKDPRFGQVEESMNWMMRFPSGVTMNGYAGYNVYHVQRYQLFFTKGWAELNPAFPYSGVKMRIGRLGSDGKEVIEEHQFAPKNQFSLEMDHMATCVIDHRAPRTGGEEGLQDMKVIEAIYKSAADHRPVTLPASSKLDASRGPEATPDDN